MNIIFFGAGPYVIPVIEFLNTTYNLKLVVTTEQKSSGPVYAYCRTQHIPLLSVRTLKDETVLQQLRKIQAPVAVIAYFGIIVSQAVIDIFPKGIINIHPSLLPKYRGTTPGQAAIRNGDSETGVSIMLIDKDIDHGPVLAQKPYTLSPDETADEFYKNIFQLGTKLLADVLDAYLNGTLKLIPQDHTKATFTKSLTRLDGYIDANNPPNKEALQRMIRAYYPWPGVWTELRIKNDTLRIKLLPNNKIQPEGKKPMTVKDFLNGYPEMKEWIEKVSASYNNEIKTLPTIKEDRV